MGSCEKFRNFKFFHGFWIEVIWNLMMVDLVLQKKGAWIFFLWKCLSHRCLSPLSHREAVTGLVSSQHNSIFLGRSASGPIGQPLFHFYWFSTTIQKAFRLNHWNDPSGMQSIVHRSEFAKYSQITQPPDMRNEM